MTIVQHINTVYNVSFDIINTLNSAVVLTLETQRHANYYNLNIEITYESTIFRVS